MTSIQSSSPSTIAMLGTNCHGKGRVRVVKVKRTPNKHYVQQYNVQILVEGDAVIGSYYTGDNTHVLPTDTIKNTVYVLAKTNEFHSMEEFGCIIAKYFVTQHSEEMTKATVSIIEENWVRIINKDSNGQMKEHHHAFVRQGSEERFCKVVAKGKKNYGQPELSVMSGLRDLKVLKTTQSSFENFKRDQYTTLPDVSDRLVGTIVTATWRYENVTNPTIIKTFAKQAKDIRDTLVDTFAGPADVGTPSPAVQYTLWKMGEAVLEKYSNVIDITMNMPNVHNLPYDQSKFGLYNEHPHGEIFIPVDEPHGIIEATVTRNGKSNENATTMKSRSRL